MCVTLELGTQSHHHYNPLKMNSLPAFTDQKQLSAPTFTDVTHSLKLTGASLPCFSAVPCSVLCGDTRIKHRLQQPHQDAPRAATATIIFPALPVVPTPLFLIFLHLPVLPFNSMSPSVTAVLGVGFVFFSRSSFYLCCYIHLPRHSEEVSQLKN